jgi:hypothetical protein
MAAAQVENGLIFHEYPTAGDHAFHPRAEYLQTQSAGLLAPTPDDFCPLCRPLPLDRERCRRIRAVHRATAGNVPETARQPGLSRTTVCRHLDGGGGPV